MFTMIAMKELGEALFRRREQLGLTQRQFGDRIGKDPAYISRLEQGRTKETPPPEVLQAIAGELGISQARMLAMIGYTVGEPEPVGDTVTIPADDPRARLLAAVDGLPDHVVNSWADSISAITNAASQNRNRDIPLPHRERKPQSA